MDETTRRVGQLFRNFLALGAGNYAAMAVALAINAMVTRRLGAEQFGRLALLLMASQVLSLVAANWTFIGVVRFGAREFASTGSVASTFWTRIWVSAPWAAAGAVAMVAGRDRLSAYLGIPTWGVLVVLGHFLASFVLTTVGAAFQAKNEMRRYGAMLFLDKALMAILVFGLPWSWVRDPLTVIGLYAASSIAVGVWGLVALGARSLVPIVFSRPAYRSMLSFSLPLVLSSWAGLFGTNWFDYVIIKWYRPLSDLGLYSLGSVLAGVVQQITIIFSTLLLPQFSVMVANNEQEKIEAFVQRFLPYWFLGTSVLLSLVLMGIGPVVPMVFGPAFKGTVPVLALLVLATCALALFNAFSPLVSAYGSTWILSGICLVSGAVNVAMDLVLIPPYGILGAALATVIAYGVSATLVLAFVRTRVQGRVFALGLLVLPVVVACVCFLLLDGVGFYLLAIPAGSVSVYWLVSRFRLFRGEDAAFLRELRVRIPLAPGVLLAADRKRTGR